MNLKNYKRSEATEQIRLFDWAKRHEEYVPELQLIFHVPNEGKRTNGELLKAMGLKRVFRIFVCLRRSGDMPGFL